VSVPVGGKRNGNGAWAYCCAAVQTGTRSLGSFSATGISRARTCTRWPWRAWDVGNALGRSTPSLVGKALRSDGRAGARGAGRNLQVANHR
jgi:hypothetical protein